MNIAPLGRGDRFLDIVHRMTSKVLGDLAAKNFRQLLVVALAKFAEGARGGDDDDEIRNLAIEHPLLSKPAIPPAKPSPAAWLSSGLAELL